MSTTSQPRSTTYVYKSPVYARIENTLRILEIVYKIQYHVLGVDTLICWKYTVDEYTSMHYKYCMLLRLSKYVADLTKPLKK